MLFVGNTIHYEVLIQFLLFVVLGNPRFKAKKCIFRLKQNIAH